MLIVHYYPLPKPLYSQSPYIASTILSAMSHSDCYHTDIWYCYWKFNHDRSDVWIMDQNAFCGCVEISHFCQQTKI